MSLDHIILEKDPLGLGTPLNQFNIFPSRDEFGRSRNRRKNGICAIEQESLIVYPNEDSAQLYCCDELPDSLNILKQLCLLIDEYVEVVKKLEYYDSADELKLIENSL